MTQTTSNEPKADASETEELVHADDSVIGRAVLWSAIALVVLGGAAAAVVYAVTRKPEPPPAKVTNVGPPVAVSYGDVTLPAVRFTDVTSAAGVTFVHNNGAAGEKLLPETMGGGVAFFDYDNDGDPDLLFVNSTWWPGKVPDGKQPTTAALYRNDGKGNFADVTKGSGLDVPVYGMGVACGDVDNDGDADVFLTALGGNKLFRNNGDGSFADVTAGAGVGGASGDWSTAAAFFDYDNDGRLDLFVGNYVQWTPEIDFQINYTLDGTHRAYGPPNNYKGAFPYLYRNEGGGRFADASQSSGVRIVNSATGVPAAKTLGAAPVDVDADGWIDLVVANDTVQNFLFHNRKDGTFKEIGALAGVGFDSAGNARGAMGIDTARFRNDARGTLGVGIGNFANEMTALYVAQGDDRSLLFTDDAIAEGVGPASRLPLKFGLYFFDYDLDGWQDLLTCNGHLEEKIGTVQQSQTYRQPAQLFWNAGSVRKGGGFVPVSAESAGPDLFKPIVGRGSAYADIDADGDLDVVFTQVAGPPLLLRNEQQLGHHHLRLKLVGNKTNRDAIGAWVKVRLADKTTLWRQVMPTRSYLSQSELPVTVGLGKSDKVEAVEVIWPDGSKRAVELKDVRVDGVVVVEQAK